MTRNNEYNQVLLEAPVWVQCFTLFIYCCAQAHAPHAGKHAAHVKTECISEESSWTEGQLGVSYFCPPCNSRSKVLSHRSMMIRAGWKGLQLSHHHPLGLGIGHTQVSIRIPESSQVRSPHRSGVHLRSSSSPRGGRASSRTSSRVCQS